VNQAVSRLHHQTILSSAARLSPQAPFQSIRCRPILSRSRSTRQCTCCHAGVSIYRLRRFSRCRRNARTAAKRAAMTRTHIRDMAVALSEFANFTQAAWPIHGLQIKVRSSSARSAPSPPPPAVAQSRPGSGASSLRLGDSWSAYDSMQRPLAPFHTREPLSFL
jgi:hypothetical protein